MEAIENDKYRQNQILGQACVCLTDCNNTSEHGNVQYILDL